MRQGGFHLFRIQHSSGTETFRSERPLCLFGGAKLQNNLDEDMAPCHFFDIFYREGRLRTLWMPGGRDDNIECRRRGIANQNFSDGSDRDGLQVRES